MEELIASYIIQAGHCSLPSLGAFKLHYAPAKSDVANKQILPPDAKVEFSENDDALTPGLVDYVMSKQECSPDHAREMIRNWTATVSEKIGHGNPCTLPLLGKLYRGDDGNVAFEEDMGNKVLQPVRAERVIHTHESHAMLVGDKESSTEEMNTLLQRQEPETKYRWWIAALMLFLVGLLLLAMYLSGDHPSRDLFGNGSTHTPVETPDTYISK